MTELGKVTAVKGNTATVRIDKKDECSKCGMCLFSNNANYTEMPASNELGAKVGDTVEIRRTESLKLISILLVFLVPLVLIGLACGLTYLFMENELWMLGFSVIFILLWYTILAFIDRKIKKLKGFSNVITQIVQKEENITDGNN